MKVNRIIILGLFLAIAVLFAGCTGSESGVTQPVPQETPVATPAPVVPVETIAEVTQVPVDAIWDQPVTEPPADISVSITVQKDQVFDTIIATFNGGFGQSLVSAIQVRVITSDGRDEIQPLGSNTGDNIQFVGTSQEDEVMVAVWYMNGDSYKISDQVLGFQPVVS